MKQNLSIWLIGLIFCIGVPFALADTKSDVVLDCVSKTKFSHRLHEKVPDRDIKTNGALDFCEEARKQEPYNPQVKFGLARAYQATKQFDRAKALLEQLAAENHPDANYLLANSYFYGDGTSKSLQKYFDTARRAYDLGSKAAAMELYYIHSNGWGVPADSNVALDFLMEAVGNNVSEAIDNYAEMLAYGFGGVDQDVQKAKMVLEPEIELGNVFAEANYFVIVSDFPNDAAELRVAINQLNRLAFSHFDESIEQAAWQLAWIHLNPNWKEEVGDKFGFSQNTEKGYAAFASLLDSYHGLTLAQEFITLELGAQFSQRQGQEVISKLIAIATNPFEIDEASSVEAANILAQIYENGIFGPIEKSKAVELYELAATEYDDGESAVAAGWEYWASPEIYDLAKAFKYTQLATSSKEFLMRAYAHNNLGVFYSYSSERNTKMALAEFQKSVEYFEMMDFTLDWPFDNVARIYLFGDDPKLRDIKTAAEFAAKSDKNDGTGYLTDFIQKYPINEKSALSEIRQWLEKDAREGEPSAFIELAYFLEIHGSDEEVITWFTLCRTLCREEDKKRALDALGRYGRTMRGALFSIADANATEWINEEYLKVSNEIAANTERDTSNKILLNGDFHALLIGVSKYQHLESLGTPIRDISAIEAALKSRYGAKTKTLMNPIRSEITTELNRLVKSLSPEDALLVYFAGHGYLDDAVSEGYWLPSDAEKDDDTNYISNGYIRGKLRAIPAKNVLLIADSCFSGSIISRGIEIPKVSSPKSAIEKYLETKSRVSITSGGLKPVLDGGGGSHSVFAAAFIEVLQEQDAPFTSADLYLKLRDSVTQKSLALGYDQTPLRGEMPNHGHDGPDFVFVPK